LARPKRSSLAGEPSPFNEADASFSPDGRFIAFDVDEEREGENVYLQPYPGPGPRTPVSIGEGRAPMWERDGRQLFYWSGRHLMVVPVETQPVLSVSRPQALFEMARPPDLQVAADGRFLRWSPRSPVEGPLELQVVLNWFEELERLAPRLRR
jgi:hypothetical protein